MKKNDIFSGENLQMSNIFCNFVALNLRVWSQRANLPARARPKKGERKRGGKCVSTTTNQRFNLVNHDQQQYQPRPTIISKRQTNNTKNNKQ